MTKVCPVCNQPLKTNDTVVAVFLAKFKLNENSYDLGVMGQSIVSHAVCVSPAKEGETK